MTATILTDLSPGYKVLSDDLVTRVLEHPTDSLAAAIKSVATGDGGYKLGMDAISKVAGPVLNDGPYKTAIGTNSYCSVINCAAKNAYWRLSVRGVYQ